VQRLESEVTTLEAELKRENARPETPAAPPSQPDNPVYTQLSTQLAATQHEQNGVAEQISRLKAQMASYQRKISVSPQVEREYRELARDYQNAQAKYQEIRAKQMEAQVAQNLEADRKGERFTLIEPPLPPEEPVSPNRTIISVLGVLLSIAIAGGAVALLEMLDGTVRGRKDMLLLLPEAPLALIPRIGTDGEVRVMKQRWRYALGGVAVAALTGILAVHFVYRPIDVLWFAVLRKLGL
jgi:uncharacterized protein involved in exopolysaccharide biosynthesis